MALKKGQMFIISIVFFIGMIFVVQQALFNYSAVDMSSAFEIHDAEVFDSILGIVDKTITESYYCNETKDSFQERMEKLKASFLEEHGKEYSIEILYTLDCSNWDNFPPNPAPLSLGLSLSRQGRDTRGNFQLYHSGYYTIVSDSQTLANGSPAVPTWVHSDWTADIPGATWIWSEYLVSDPTNNVTVNFTRTFNLPAGSFQGSLTIAADNFYTCYLNGLFIAADRGFMVEDRYSLDGMLQNGLNTFRCEVMNLEAPGSTPYLNPAGLLYKISIYGAYY